MSAKHAIIPERLAFLDNLTLDKGSHAAWEDGACLLETVSYIAGEPFSDHPTCVSPVLIAYGVALNDSWPDEQRQKLVPFIPRMIGTAGDGQDEARSFLALDWLVRTYTPAWLDLAGLSVEASALREHPPITDMAGIASVEPLAVAAYSAAYSVAYSVARSAAYSAARSAAYWAAYWAAYSAARSAARSAAYWAAYSAADPALAPTVELIKDSALDLLDRMIDPSAVTA